MTSLRLQPYPVLAPGACVLRRWSLRRASGDCELGPELDEWDASTTVTLLAQVAIGSDAIETLPSGLRLVVVATAESEATVRRFTACGPLSSGEGTHNASVELEIPAGAAAGTLELRLTVSTTQGANGVPVGARLLTLPSERLRLEGSGSRFPVSAFDFGIRRPDVPWIVDVSYLDPEDSFMGSVRVELNRNHPATELLLDSPDDLAGEIVASALRTDIAHSLVAHLAADDRFEAPPSVDSPDDSLHAVADRLLRDLVGRDLASLVAGHRADPVGTERTIRARTGYLRSVR